MGLFTVGHSNRSAEEFVDLLRTHSVELVADVRRFPGSKRQPHFAREALASTLEKATIRYVHIPHLGGRRGARESPGVDAAVGKGWRVPGFANYARYMQTPPFQEGLQELEQLAAERRAAILCSEGVWWRCHRQLVADAMLVRGWCVLHILGPGEPQPHRLTPFAVVDGTTIIYPAQQADLL